MRTLLIDIINEKAMAVLKDLESHKMIKVRGRKSPVTVDWKKYKGAVTRQSPGEIEAQLIRLREEWT